MLRISTVGFKEWLETPSFELDAAIIIVNRLQKWVEPYVS
jgi:hypothetical protein